MDISITGRHVTLDEAFRTYAEDKLSQLERYCDRITSVSAVVIEEHGEHTVELIALIPKVPRMMSRAEGSDLRGSFDTAEERLISQIRAYKSKLVHRRTLT